MKIDIQKLEKSEAKIVVSIPEAAFMKHYDGALAKIQEVAEIDGFRKGHAPQELILSKYGEMAILEEMADMTVNETFIDAIKESKIDAIGRPSIVITKLAKGSDLEYTITVAVMPVLELPEYKKLASGTKQEEVQVSDKDIEDVLLELRKMRAHQDMHKTHEHSEEAEHHAKHTAIDEGTSEHLPELNDEFAASLGDFKSVVDLKAKVTENLKLEKTQKAKEKRRNEILDLIEKDTKGEIPQILIEGELDRMMAQMKGDVAQMGGSFEEYLAYIKKTESDLRAEWIKDAEKRARIQIILNQIATADKIDVEKEAVEKEAKRLAEMYSEVDMEKAYDYMHQMMLNEAVLVSLEK